jgi:Domain of unknown function (DUF5658)
MPSEPPFRHPVAADRRQGGERRSRLIHAILTGSVRPRRRGHRRHDELRRLVDWHDARWLAVVMLILILSTVDAMLTLALVAQGLATEANPVMAPLVRGGGLDFALWKLGLTAVGVITLTVLARQRVFGWLTVGTVLYGVLGIYTALIGYELAVLLA